MFSGTPFLYLRQKVRKRSESMSESLFFFWNIKANNRFPPRANHAHFSLIKPRCGWTYSSYRGAFDLWFCFVPGTVEGSLYAVHWARWVPYGMLKPHEPWNFSGSRLRFMNTEHAQSIRQLSLWAARASRSTLLTCCLNWLRYCCYLWYRSQRRVEKCSRLTLVFFSLCDMCFSFFFIFQHLQKQPRPYTDTERRPGAVATWLK